MPDTLRKPLAKDIITQHPDESRVRPFDFDEDLASGESLSGSPTVEELDTADLTIGSPTISGTQVLARVSGGSENTLYYLQCTAATDQGNTLVLVGRIKITREQGETPAA